MIEQNETVFEFGGEGGGISIVRQRNWEGEKFLYQHGEMGVSEPEVSVNISGEYDNFSVPFGLINNRYRWYTLQLLTVHSDFREYVILQLIERLNQVCASSDELRDSQSTLEEILNIKLAYGYLPLRNGMQDISIRYEDGTVTEYDYENYSGHYSPDDVHQDDLKISKMHKTIKWKVYKCKGTLEIIGSTAVVKDEFKQTHYVISTNRAIIAADPILGKTQGWFFSTM